MNEMSDDDLTTAEARPLSPLQIFFVKVAIVTAAIVAILYCASYFFESFIASKADQLTFLKGGPAFWGRIETKLYSLADEPDLPPEKKRKRSSTRCISSRSNTNPMSTRSAATTRLPPPRTADAAACSMSAKRQ